ncbi:MAG: NAD(P)-dependent oxidoreductase [Treponema sp.]|jgi:nucleoside-diphosphate-sugar epimerase|nr:NAD(P)-dependent oxidoreductase [Treponema sp.]
MSKNILVTGGSGRVGNYVTTYLKDNGYNVANFDYLPPKPDSLAAKAGIPFILGNLTNLGDCMRAISFAQADAVVHLAAIPFNTDLVPPFAGNWSKLTDGARFVQRLPWAQHEWDTMEINTMGSFFIVDAMRRLGVKQLIAASSYFVLGIGFRLSGTSFQPSYLPMDEDHPLLPEDTYSLSKVLGEEIYKSFGRAYGLNTVAMRFMGVFVPPVEGQPDPRKEWPVKVPAADDENKGYLISDTFQYIDARDIAIFVKLSLESKKLGQFEPFYVVSDTKYDEPTKDIVARRWPFLAEKAKDIPGTEGIISGKRAEKILGFKSEYTWRKGLKTTF